MTKPFRTGLGFGLAGLLAIALVACGGGGDSQSGATGGSEANVSGKIAVWDFEYETTPGYTKAIKALDAEFEKLHPGVTIERTAQPYENYEAIYRAAFTAHEGPDIMTMSPGQSGVLSYKNGLEELNDRISPEMNESISQWESVTPGLAAEGPRYGVPFGIQGWVFYYNKQLFAKAGLSTSFQPKSWGELISAGKRLKAAGIQPFAGGNKEGSETWGWFSLGFQSANTPQQTTELAEGKMSYTDEAVTKAFQPEIETQEAGLYPSDRFGKTAIEGFTQFAEGKGAMILGFWTTGGYWGDFNPAIGEKNLGIFYPPGNAQVGTLAGYADSIPVFAKNKDAAWALIEFLSSKKASETFFREAGILPNRGDVTLPKSAPVQARELVEASRSPERVIAPNAALQAAVNFGTMPAEMNQVLQGRTSLEGAQEAMQETAEKTRVE
ncbi:MAG: extracellular solute-binding protein [Actinobacteria bacterium]|nr:extracellular solute-binding protein [Actinomycetota bacterium]